MVTPPSTALPTAPFRAHGLPLLGVLLTAAGLCVIGAAAFVMNPPLRDARAVSNPAVLGGIVAPAAPAPERASVTFHQHRTRAPTHGSGGEVALGAGILGNHGLRRAPEVRAEFIGGHGARKCPPCSGPAFIAPSHSAVSIQLLGARARWQSA